MNRFMKLSNLLATADSNQIIRIIPVMRSRELPMALPSQIISTAPPMTHAPKIIHIGWNDPTKQFHIPLCTNDNMPMHIKGDAQWLEKEGVWNYHIHDLDGGLWPVAFFNNNWWLVNVEGGETLSRAD